MVIFECHYCKAQLPNLSEAIKHFEVAHQRSEYVVISAPIDMVETKNKKGGNQ